MTQDAMRVAFEEAIKATDNFKFGAWYLERFRDGYDHAQVNAAWHWFKIAHQSREAEMQKLREALEKLRQHFHAYASDVGQFTNELYEAGLGEICELEENALDKADAIARKALTPAKESEQ